MAAASRADGSLPVSRTIAANGWTTPYAILLWSQFAQFESHRRRAREWLLRLEGRTLPRSDRSGGVVGHDTALVGWPWVEGTHSWLEPTALAILALCRDSSGDHPRVRAGVQLIRDRALESGGWSAAGKAFFGHEVRAQPAPTGLALLALAACNAGSDVVDGAIAYLSDALPTMRAPISLGWSLLGLRAHGIRPSDSESWMAESYDRLAHRDDRALGMAVLLLALSESAPGLLGAQPQAPAQSQGTEQTRASAAGGRSWHRDGRAPMNRRKFLTGIGGAATAGLAADLAWKWNEAGLRAQVFVAKAASYAADLETIIASGLTELGLGPAWVEGRTVLLKPNLVEPYQDAPQINTHASVVRAAALVFRRWRASEVLVAEGPGHCRDSQLVLDQSGLAKVLAESRLDFVDLNHDEVEFVPNRLRQSPLNELALPLTLKRAQLVVSLPKMKTHHWAGVTLSLKNLFGIMPGIVYGWPKNVLHHAGIESAILDIAAAVRPHLAIVDGIVGMEGDGPIMGSPRHSGVLVMGANLTAVDATCARLMMIKPERVAYLKAASGRLGSIAERHIEQRGETISSLAQRFELVDRPWFSVLRS